MELTVKISIRLVLQEGSRPKVDQLEVAGGEVNDQVLILDVPVDNSLGVASQHSLQYLKYIIDC